MPRTPWFCRLTGRQSSAELANKEIVVYTGSQPASLKGKLAHSI